MSKFILYAGLNSHVVKLTNVINEETGEFINDAIVRLESIKDYNGINLNGVIWPLIMNKVTGIDGEYSAILPSSAEIIAGQLYTSDITATALGGFDGQWKCSTVAKTRISC